MNLENFLSDKFDLIFLQNFACHTFAKDRNGVYLHGNDHLIKNVGFNKMDDLLGLTDYDLSFLLAEEIAIFRKHDTEVITKRSAKVAFEPATLANGRKVMAISHKAPLYAHSKKIHGIMGVSLIVDREAFSNLVTELDMGTLFPRALNSPTAHNLTPRQIDCLYYLAKGMTAKQIAANLSISQRTVEQHLKAIKTKLNCRWRTELVAKALTIEAIRTRL